jgi:hypothetical protein
VDDVECVHTIQEFQVKDIEQGVINVGQSWRTRMPSGQGEGGSAPADTGSQRNGPGMGIPRPDSSTMGNTREVGTLLGNLPQDLNQLVAQVQWLQRRIEVLERELSHSVTPTTHSSARPLPSKVEFKIQKLYVKELTGTLNIGVTSIHDGPFEWTAPEVDPTDEGEADWRRLEQEGDEDWLTDNLL